MHREYNDFSVKNLDGSRRMPTQRLDLPVLRRRTPTQRLDLPVVRRDLVQGALMLQSSVKDDNDGAEAL